MGGSGAPAKGSTRGPALAVSRRSAALFAPAAARTAGTASNGTHAEHPVRIAGHEVTRPDHHPTGGDGQVDLAGTAS